jgi:hypothetical protein
MAKSHVEISEESGDVYLLGNGSPKSIGHIEDFVDQRTPLAKAVRICWKEYLRRLDRFATRAASTNGFSA